MEKNQVRTKEMCLLEAGLKKRITICSLNCGVNFYIQKGMESDLSLFMALGINQVTYSNRQFCRSVGPGFATLGTSM